MSTDTPDDFPEYVQPLAAALIQRDWMLATAESCSGGWIAKVLTDRAGSSAWFAGGIVSYADAAKRALLDVSGEVLAHDGAVSERCAQQMAAGALARFDVQVSVAVTGIAGPDGGSAEKPVGTVWIAWARADRGIDAQRFVFAGDRDAVRRQTVAASLGGLLTRLRD